MSDSKINMNNIHILYESLDAKTRKRFDDKLTEREEYYNSTKYKESIVDRETKDGCQWMYTGAMITLVSLIIVLCAFYFGSIEFVTVFGFLAFIGLFTSIVGFCTWGHFRF